MIPKLFAFLGSAIEARAMLVVGAAVLITAGFAYGLRGLSFSTSQDTLIDSHSKVYQDNQRYQDAFGGEYVVALVEGDVRKMFEPDNLREIQGFIADVSKDANVHSVVSPLSAVEMGVEQAKSQAASAVTELAKRQDGAASAARAAAVAAGKPQAEVQAAEDAARQEALTAFLGERAADVERFMNVGELSINNPKFAEMVLFDGEGQPRPEVRDMVPDPQHALIVVRMKGSLPFDEQAETSGFVRERAHQMRLDGLTVLPTGGALLLKAINDGMRTDMILMSLVSVAVMIAVLYLVFKARWRLLSLPVVLAAAVWFFSVLGLASFDLTIVTISAMPILIGLGVDFAIQVHNRYDEERERADNRSALSATFASTGVALFLAAVAAGAGFSALQLSDVPMIRDFSLMLAIGTLILFVAALIVAGAALVIRDRRPAPHRTPRAAVPVDRVIDTVARRTTGQALPIMAAGLALLLVGLWADRHLTLQTDPERFISSDSPVLKDLQRLRQVTGSSGEIGFLVEAQDVRDPEVLAWLADGRGKLLDRHPELISGSSPASLVDSLLGRPPASRDEAASVLDGVPQELRRNVISDDGTEANLVFTVGNMSLAAEKKLVNTMVSELKPPAGVTASPGGLAVVGVATVDALGSNRTLMSVVALASIFAVLLVAFRSIALAAAALLPVLFALGLSTTALYLLGIELNPLTAVSGPLVIAMGTEFTVLLMSRYREERALGREPEEALAMTSERIGRAIFASGLTVIGGFGALMFAELPLLQDFGKVSALNMALSLASALVVLPPVLLWLDEQVGVAPREVEPARK